MKSSYSIFDNIYLIKLSPLDIGCFDLGKQFLDIFRAKTPVGVVIDLALFEIITTDDIKLVESLIKIFKLNNIKTIVCGFNVSSVAIIFHFIDSISFDTRLDVESAMNVFKNN